MAPDLSFDQIQDLVLYALRQAVLEDTNFDIGYNDLPSSLDRYSHSLEIVGVRPRMMHKAISALKHRKYVVMIQHNGHQLDLSGAGMLYVDRQLIDSETFLGRISPIVQIHASEDGAGHWQSAEINIGEDVVPASDRFVSSRDNAWNEPDYDGNLDSATEDKIRELIKKFIEDLPSANLSNSDYAQALARLEAADKLANAPVSQWGKVHEILAPMVDIAVIGTSIAGIIIMLAGAI